MPAMEKVHTDLGSATCHRTHVPFQVPGVSRLDLQLLLRRGMSDSQLFCPDRHGDLGCGHNKQHKRRTITHRFWYFANERCAFCGRKSGLAPAFKIGERCVANTDGEVRRPPLTPKVGGCVGLHRSEALRRRLLANLGYVWRHSVASKQQRKRFDFNRIRARLRRSQVIFYILLRREEDTGMTRCACARTGGKQTISGGTKRLIFGCICVMLGFGPWEGVGLLVQPALAFDGKAAPDDGLPSSGDSSPKHGNAPNGSGQVKTSIASEYAANHDETAKQWKLGEMYANGDGVSPDARRAFEYFNKIADGHPDETPGTPQSRFVADAFVALGRYYLTGIPNSDVTANLAQAQHMFSYAAMYFANADAQYELGHLYLAEPPQNPHEAARWFQLAANKGQCHPSRSWRPPLQGRSCSASSCARADVAYPST